jgi:hypothetical protein
MKVLKYLFIIFFILGLAGLIAYWVYDKPLPEGQQGMAAEALADEMLLAVNDSAWQATPVVSWNFKNAHTFVWDKERNYTKVSWDNYDIYVNLSNKSGVAFVKGKKVKDSTATAEFVNRAYGYWVNDSFWLNPITKIRDAGTSRTLVDLEDPNAKGLLVSYSSGGLTPGDSYLWIVDNKTNRPTTVQMWVSVIPLGGVEFSWEEYVKTETNAIISTYHDGPIEVSIYELKTYDTIAAFEEGDVFSILTSN